MTKTNLLDVIRYLKNALQSSKEPWLVEAYNVCKEVLERAK